MAKSLRSMSEFERKAAIARRLSSKTMGLGYWGAFDAQARLTKRAVDLGWTCAKCGCSNIESDLLCGFCDTPRPSH